MAIELDFMEYATPALAQSNYPSSDVVANPNHQWKMNDNAASTTVVDSMGNNNGTAAGNTNLFSAAGKINTALDFNGSSDKVTTSAAASLPSTGLSVCAWVNVDETTVRHFIVSDDDNMVSGDRRWILEVNAGGTIRSWVFTASDVQTAETTDTLTAGTWYHIMAVYNGATLKIYINNVEKATVNLTGNITATSEGYWIGADNWAGGRFWMDGKIDDVRVYNFALNAAERLAIYREGNGTEDQNPQRYLACFSEATIKTQGSYSLKGFAAITDSLNDTLTRTVSPIDLSGRNQIYFGIYTSRTGSNIKIGIRDSGGTTTEKTHAVSSANTWETDTWDISAVSNINKDAIDRIIITITNADAANTFYIDNMYGGEISFIPKVYFIT